MDCTAPFLLHIFILLLLSFSPHCACENGRESSLYDDYTQESLHTLFTDLERFTRVFANESAQHQEAFNQLVEYTAKSFDTRGYKWLMDHVLNNTSTMRFTQAISHPLFNRPHCDKGKWVSFLNTLAGKGVQFPGGPLRGGSGYDLTRWLSSMFAHVHTPASANDPGMANMAVQAFNQIKGTIQSVVAILVDLVPPAIMGMPLPCLPMLTGANCLGSVLYPISAPDFTMADVIDSAMNGIISNFPAKYAAKVGKTSSAQYYFCATSFLGMHCANLFPICTNPLSRVTETFPMWYVVGTLSTFSFTHCLQTLIACPGFWIEDIAGPCSNVSIPPFCSFSAYINYSRIPPQYSSFDASHLYPDKCPKHDDKLDVPLDLYDKKGAGPSPIGDAAKEKLPELNMYESLVKELDFKVAEGKEKPCKCEEIRDLCKLHDPYPLHVQGTSTRPETHYQMAAFVTSDQKRCCIECKPIWHILDQTVA